MPNAQKISIALTREQLDALQGAVESGEYATTSEVVRDALRDWQWKRQLRGEDLKRIGQQWQQGKASGTPAPLDMQKTRQEARRLLKKASSQSA